MRAKTIGTLRKWKRDALELRWKCDYKETLLHSEVKLTATRMIELAEELLAYTANYKVAHPILRTPKEG